MSLPIRHTAGERYPFKPVCPCGARFRGYVTRTAAGIVADAHQCKGSK